MSINTPINQSSSVVMDGTCTGSFPLIRGKYPYMHCFTCPTHGLNGYIKNICVSKEEIQMQRNEMGGVGVQHVTWDEDFFEKAFAQVHSGSECTSEALGPIPCNCRITAD